MKWFHKETRPEGAAPTQKTIDGDEVHPGFVVCLRSQVGRPWMTVQCISWKDGRWRVQCLWHADVLWVSEEARQTAWYDAHVLALYKPAEPIAKADDTPAANAA